MVTEWGARIEWDLMRRHGIAIMHMNGLDPNYVRIFMNDIWIPMGLHIV